MDKVGGLQIPEMALYGTSQVWWRKPLILALREAETGGSLRVQGQPGLASEFQVRRGGVT